MEANTNKDYLKEALKAEPDPELIDEFFDEDLNTYLDLGLVLLVFIIEVLFVMRVVLVKG